MAKPVKPKPVETLFGVDWYDLRDLGVEGKGFRDTEHFYDRLPARARQTVRRGVWDMACKSSGLHTRFVTDATMVEVRWKLRLDMRLENTAGTATRGVDLYVRDGASAGGAGKWCFVANGVTPGDVLAGNMGAGGFAPGNRQFMVYLPLYSGIESAQVGVPRGAVMMPAPPWPGGGKPICFYGTSITHGGCASRPGMTYPAIISRRLERPMISVGVDGNAQMDIEVARLLAEVEASIYVLDPVHNMSLEMIAQRTEPFIRLLRKARPATPIVLMEGIQGRTGARNHFAPTQKNLALREAVKPLLAPGAKRVPGLRLVDVAHLLGGDGEGTVDGIHPNDLGFMRMAEALLPHLRTMQTH